MTAIYRRKLHSHSYLSNQAFPIREPEVSVVHVWSRCNENNTAFSTDGPNFQMNYTVARQPWLVRLSIRNPNRLRSVTLVRETLRVFLLHSSQRTTTLFLVSPSHSTLSPARLNDLAITSPIARVLLSDLVNEPKDRSTSPPS